MIERLGIIDWGIGGISIHKLIKEKLGNVPIVYFSDTGVTPYGKMNRSDHVSRLAAVIEYLKTLGVSHVVFGCNAASTALPYLEDHGVKIEGMIDSAVAAAVEQNPNRLGLIGGRQTVVSGIYRRKFAEKGINVRQRIAQPLSGLIESGDISSDKLRVECQRILSPLKTCSHILLACTHYPAIIPVLNEFVSAETRFIDPASELVKRLAAWKLPKDGGDVYLTTGESEKMKKAALAAFDQRIESVREVTV